MRRRVLSIVWLAGLLAAPAAVAHESRHVGPKGEYNMTVGWIIEPAFLGGVNGVDIYLSRTMDNRAINTAKGDVVDLQVEVQLRVAEDPRAAVLESAMLAQKPTLAFNTENRYNAWFEPTRPGVYAFHVKGSISDAGDPKAGPVTIDEVFICGSGSKDHGGHHHSAFVCLLAPQMFPATKASGTKDRPRQGD